LPKSLWHDTETARIIEPYFYQAVLLLADYHEIYVSTGVGAGKTTMAAVWLLYNQMLTPGNLIWVEPITPMLSSVAIPTWLALVKDTLFEGKWNSKREGDYQNRFGHIFFKTAENPEHIQGIPNVVAAVIDEVGQVSRLAHYYTKARLKQRNGRLLGLTNPYRNKDPWLYKEVYQKYLRGELDDVLFLVYSSLENPSFNREVYEQDKKRLSPEELAFLYHGEYVKPTGLVFDYDDDIVGDYDVKGVVYGGMDFGMGDATVVEAGVVNGNHLHIFDEYYTTGKSVSEQIDKFIAFLKRTKISTMFYDPSGKIYKEEYRRLLEEKGVHLNWKTADNDILKGIDREKTLFAEKRLTISPKCRHLLDEDASYIYASDGKPVQKNRNGITVDCEDARRYLVMGVWRLLNKKKLYIRQKKELSPIARHFENLFKKKKKTDWVGMP
jgi:hypothetical protein